MPFDPTKPANNTPNSSAEMRMQLTSLKALIDAIPNITSAEVSEVLTLPPGTPASVGISLNGSALTFSFQIPQGDVGAPGEVSAADLQSAITTTSNNCNSVGTLGQSADINYNQMQMQDIINKLDQLISTLYR